MSNYSAFKSILFSELLALHTVLRSTQCTIQRINLSSNFPGNSRKLDQDQLNELSQQLQYLLSVGSKLSSRWEKISNLSEEQAKFLQILSHKFLNLLDIISITIAMVGQQEFKLAKTHQLDRMEQAIEEVKRWIENVAVL